MSGTKRGAGALFALVDPCLDCFRLHANTHNFPSVANAHQDGPTLGVGKCSECFDHFFLKAALEFDKRIFAPINKFQQPDGWRFAGRPA